MFGTFGEWRRSRHVTQAELAALTGASLSNLKKWENRLLTGSYFQFAYRVDHYLTQGPHACIKAKTLHPVTLLPMKARTRERLREYACFVSFEYFQPDEVQEAQLRMSRPDLHQFWRAHQKQRIIVLYRVMKSRYAREWLRQGFGVIVADMKLATLSPLREFQPMSDVHAGEAISA